MATMQGYISGQENQLDELPSWKRDLILRKRANVRMHGGAFGLPTPTPSSMAGRGRGSLSGRPQLSSTLSGPLSSVSGPSSSIRGPVSSVSGPVSSIRGPHLPLIRSVSGPPCSYPYPSNNNAVSPRLEGARTVVSGGGDGSHIQKCVVKSEIVSANISNMHHKGLHDEGPRVTSPTYSSFSDSCANMQKDEDFSYGPGIVSKLKNRYMSLAMRDNRSRPSLRKFSSLEDLLDDPRESSWPDSRDDPPDTHHHNKPRHGGHHPAQSNSSSSAASHRREVMKRARSVDSLSSRLLSEETRSSTSRGLPKSKSATSRLQASLSSALQKDDVIIIENTKPRGRESRPQQRHPQVNGVLGTQSVDGGEPPPLTRKMSSSSMGEEADLPPPDTVRQYKKIFEPSRGRASRGTNARIASHKAATQNNNNNKSNGLTMGVVPTSSKPAIKAKPTDIPPRKTSTPLSPAYPVTIEEAKCNLKQVATVTRASPKSTLSVRATALNGSASSGGGGEESEGGGEVSRARPGLTPVTASVTAPLVNGVGEPRPVESNSPIVVEEGVRKVSNIRKESESQAFDFTRSSSTQQSHSTSKVKPSSPTPTPLPASPVVSHRVPPTPPHAAPLTDSTTTSVSKIAKSSQESDRVQQENLKNVEKSRGGPKVDSSSTTTTSLRSPSKNGEPLPLLKLGPKGELVRPSPAKVEPTRPTPAPTQGKEPLRGMGGGPGTPIKTHHPQPVVLSPVESKSSFISSDELVRSQGKGSLVEAFNKSSSAESSSPVLKSSSSSANRGGDWRTTARPKDNNTLVFNFTSSKKETPDYIENDGIDLSRRIPEAKQLGSGYVYMPGWEGPRDSSTDGDDFDELGTDYLDARPGTIPPLSGIVFEGEAVIINGRSNLQRQPRNKKLNISFDDSAQTYEYPSEASLIEENMSISGLTSSDLADTDSSGSHGGLASYTPSKIQIGNSFELGVSRTAPPVQTSPPTPPVQTERVEEEYLRPADETETVTWSAESTADMFY